MHRDSLDDCSWLENLTEAVFENSRIDRRRTESGDWR
eukprot:COSAG04_NODE_27531_length_282_cov_0.836066_1_plen_36_part_10